MEVISIFVCALLRLTSVPAQQVASPTQLDVVATVDSTVLHGVRAPAFASDGRMIMSIQGNLFLRPAGGGELLRLTTGSSWHRDPTFSADGRSILFSSDRGGSYDIWRATIAADGTLGALSNLVSTPEPETMPSISSNGSIAFVRGSGGSMRIFVRDASGDVRRLTDSNTMESQPQYSPDGSRIAYVSENEAGRRVVVRNLSTNRETTANSDRNADRITWAPDGNRLAISSRAGVFVVPVDGRWSSYASAHHGDLAWSPDGKSMVIAEYDEVSVSYNGDPDRGLDRSASNRIDSGEKLYTISAPLSPDADLAGLLNETPASAAYSAERNAEIFDRVWNRSATLYFAQPGMEDRLAKWQQVKEKSRPLALSATNDVALQTVIYDMLSQRPTLRVPATGRAAVSSAHPVATEAGLEIFRLGGNVVDAAVAVSFAIGVVEPDASGVGGYGEMVIALKTLAKPTLIEFMTRVPEEASLSNTSLLQNGRYPADGPVLANVPGTVAGMYSAWQKYGSGKVAWSDLVAPAIRAAKNGYEVSEGLATTLATEQEHFAKYAGSKALFFKDGKPRVKGDTIRNTDLAWTLEQIARNGADGFYRGEVAKKWIDDIRPKGNAMQLTDLARYFAPEREPVSGTYRGYTIYSSAPPVSGGAELVARLNLLEQFPNPKAYASDAATLHAALTSWFLVPSSRGRIADPSLWPVNIAPIVNKDTARARWSCYDATRALKPADVRGDTLACLAKTRRSTTESPTRDMIQTASSGANHQASEPCSNVHAGVRAFESAIDHASGMSYCHSSGTTAFTVADADGNAVAVTQTLGTWGGNFYVTPGLGFLSNDKLTSYGTDPTQYGARLPFARHGSTLAPTIAFKGNRPVFVVGAAGNAWITSAVYQTLLGALDYGMGPQEALEQPRFLPGGGGGGGGGGRTAGDASSPPYTLQLEDGFSPEVIRRLRSLGYNLNFVSLPGELREGYGAAIRIDANSVTAGADPRRSGAAGAVKK